MFIMGGRGPVAKFSIKHKHSQYSCQGNLTINFCRIRIDAIKYSIDFEGLWGFLSDSVDIGCYFYLPKKRVIFVIYEINYIEMGNKFRSILPNFEGVQSPDL